MHKVIKATKIILIVVVSGMLLYKAFDNVRAELFYKSTLNQIEEGDVSIALDSITTAISFNPLEPNYYRLRARILLYTLLDQPLEVQMKIKGMILADLQTAVNLNPNNLVTIRNLIPVYYFLATKDTSLPASASNIDENHVVVVRNFYADAKNKFPRDVGVLALVAKYEKRLHLDSDYASTVARVEELRPDLLEWYDSFR